MTHEDIARIKKLYSKLPIIDIIAKGYSRIEINFALKGVKRRSRLESAKLLSTLHPECRKHLNKTKTKISASMKIAHETGKAHSWHNGFSYPEMFFEKVIKNEFQDQQFERQKCIGRYRLDFFWPEKNRAIEIDGRQHNSIKHQKADAIRDKFISSQGIKLLRIKWQDLFHEPKKFIKQAKAFIDNQLILDVQPLWRNKKNRKQIKQNRVQKQRKQHEEMIKSRINDINKLDLSLRGSIALLSKKWKVSHTQVQRWIKRYIPGGIRTLENGFRVHHLDHSVTGT